MSVADIAKQHSKHMALLGEGGAVAAGAEEDVEMPLMPGCAHRLAAHAKLGP